ncbi:MAG: ferredoxin [Deltaproteobacteria bacterium]|nr:MAG: ferredoxin [Deltaproteobacteria bacterium]
MAMKIIVDECLKCGACVAVCPRESITEQTDDSGETIYVIDANICTECVDEGGPQCQEECPVPECIVKAE